jgi:ABC-type nitrate/sulfonate/bicarbonate transport system substrate-binding protein
LSQRNERFVIISDVAYWKSLAQNYLEEHGMTVDDIQFVALPMADIVPNMEAGRIQAFIALPNVAAAAVQSGLGEVAAQFSEIAALHRQQRIRTDA